MLIAFQKLDFRHRITGNNLGEVSVGLNSLANVVNDMLVENKSNGLTLQNSSNILSKEYIKTANKKEQLFYKKHYLKEALKEVSSLEAPAQWLELIETFYNMLKEKDFVKVISYAESYKFNK